MFRSQADLYGNSFGSPMNHANQGSGWNIDPSLLSPSYMAPYRPGYSGPNGANRYGHPGFFGGLSQLNPMSTDAQWGNPIMHQQNAIEDITNRPADAAMWGFQRLAMPILAYGGAARALSSVKMGWRTGAAFGSGFGGGMASAFGANSQGIRATGAAISGAYKANGMMGAAQAIRGVGFGGAANLAARGLMGSTMGLAAGVGLPLAVGQGLLAAGERGLVNPYMNTRGTANDLRNNFSGITFNDMGGNAVTGKGLGFAESTNMGQMISSQGISDMSFSTDQYRQGVDMMGRTGLLDTTRGSQMTSRIKENMQQVKLIMSIASMPEMKDAIEQLAKLQMAGASTSGGLMSTAATAMGTINRTAAMAGTSVQRLMNTAGAQGQYLYQANGMTPYLGQMAAGASYSSFSAAQRMGLISPEQMARMGGLDGATQSSLTGQINGSQTLYNKMAMYNSFMGGSRGTAAGYGKGQDAISVVQGFGNSMANDPLGVYGAMSIYGRQMAGKQIEERGGLALEDQIMSRVPKWLLDGNGKLSAERAIPFLMQTGMNEDQVQAFLSERMADGDDEVYAGKRKAMKAAGAERVRQYIGDHGAYGGVIGGKIYAANKYGRSLSNSAKGLFIDPLTTRLGQAGDSVQSLVDSAWFGSSVDNANDSIEDIIGGTKRSSKSLFAINDSLDIFGVTGQRGQNRKHRGVAEDINELIQAGGDGASLAGDYMNDTSVSGRRKKLEKLINSGKLKNTWTNDYTKDYKSVDDFIGLDKALAGRGKLAYSAETMHESSKSDFLNALDKVNGRKVTDKFDSLQGIGLAVSIATNKNLTPGTADEAMASDAELQKFAKQYGIKGGAEALSAAKKMAIRARASGMDGFATVASRLDRKNYGSGDDAIKAAYEITGGSRINAMPHAGNLSEDEALGMSAEVKQESLEKMKLYQLNKEGRLDFSSMRQAITQIDNGKAVKDFQKAVDTFKQTVDQDSKNKDIGATGGGIMGWFQDRDNKQKVSGR